MPHHAAAGDDHDLGRQGRGHGLVLVLGLGQPQLGFYPWDSLLGGDGGPWRGPRRPGSRDVRRWTGAVQPDLSGPNHRKGHNRPLASSLPLW